MSLKGFLVFLRWFSERLHPQSATETPLLAEPKNCGPFLILGGDSDDREWGTAQAFETQLCSGVTCKKVQHSGASWAQHLLLGDNFLLMVG